MDGSPLVSSLRAYLAEAADPGGRAAPHGIGAAVGGSGFALPALELRSFEANRATPVVTEGWIHCAHRSAWSLHQVV